MPTWTVEAGAGAGTTVAGGPTEGYLPDQDFRQDMDQDFGPGQWTQTGGWRSQARENQLRAQGAQTVRPGRISQHSLGTEDAPGARDVVVKGMTPWQAADRVRRAGNLPYGQLYPEGSAGGQGAHLHIGMRPTSGQADQTWTVEAGAGADPAATTAAARPMGPAPPAAPAQGWSIEAGAGSPGYQPPRTTKSDLLSQAGSLAGGFLEGIVKPAVSTVGHLSDQLGQALADQAAGGVMWSPGGEVVVPKEAQPELAAMARDRTSVIAPGVTEPAAAAVGRAAQAIEPAQRTGFESFLHGVGGLLPQMIPGVATPTMIASGYGQAYDEAIAKGATVEQAQAAASEAATLQGAISLVPFSKGAEIGLGWAASKLGVAGAKGLWAVGGKILNHAISGGVLAGASQAGDNAVAIPNYDPDRPVFEGVPEAILQGVVAGTAMGGVTEAWAHRPKWFLRPTAREPARADPKTGKVEVPPDKYNDGADRMHFGPDPDLPPSAKGSGMPTSQAAARYYAEHDDDGEPPGGGAPAPRPPPPARPSPLEPAPGPTPTREPTPADYPPAPMPEPVTYESERTRYGAPTTEMPQAISDVDELRRAQPRGTSLFDAIKSLGKMRTKDEQGDAYTTRPDISEGLTATKTGKRGREYSTTFHVLTNREGKGLSPHGMAMALAEKGWFGPEAEAEPQGMAALEAFERAFNAEASGERYFHPDDADNNIRARRADLERQLDQAGVTGGDPVETASAKLAAWRHQENLKGSTEMSRLRAQADELGIEHTDATTYAALKGDVDERLAIEGEAHPSELIDGEHVDQYDRDLNVALTQAEHEWLSRAYAGAGGEPEAAGGAPEAGREPAPGREPEEGYPPPGEVAGRDRPHAQGVPQGARLAHIDPRAIRAAWEQGYQPFFSRQDDVEQAAADRQHLTVPIDEYHREVGGAAFEEHIRQHTHFQEAPTPEDEEEFLARHGATADAAGRASPLEHGRTRAQEARRAAAHARRQARLREIYREKVERGELRPRTPEERDEIAAHGHDAAARGEPSGHSEAARQVIERRVAQARAEQVRQESEHVRRTTEDQTAVEGRILASPGGVDFNLPGGGRASVRRLIGEPPRWAVVVRNNLGGPVGPEQVFADRGGVSGAAWAAAEVAYRVNDYDFTTTFPPLREDAQSPYAHSPENPNYAEEERGLHEETARALRTDLNDVRAIENMGDVDPATGRRIPDTDAGRRRREELHTEAQRAMWNYESVLNDYEDRFGGTARDAFEAFVQRTAEDAFEGRLAPEAGPEPQTPTQEHLTGIQHRTAELEVDAAAARERGDPETADRLQAHADDMARRAQAEADAEPPLDEGWTIEAGAGSRDDPTPTPPDNEVVPGIPVHPPTEPVKFTLAGPKGKGPLAEVELEQLPDGRWAGSWNAGTSTAATIGGLYHPSREDGSFGGNETFPTREGALSRLLDIVEESGIYNRDRSDSVASNATRKQGERIVKWVEAQRKAMAERQKAAVATEDTIALESQQAERRPTETLKLGGETVEQMLIPGGEASALQAAAARGEGGLRPTRVQREAGPGDLFGPPPEDELPFGQPAPEEPRPTGQLPRTGAERWDADMRIVNAHQTVEDREATLQYMRSAEARRSMPRSEYERTLAQAEQRLADARAELEAANLARGYPPALPASNELPLPDAAADRAFFGTIWQGRVAERNQAIRWARARTVHVFRDDVPVGAEDDPTQWGHYARDHYESELIHYKRITFDPPENDYIRQARRPLDEQQAETWEERAEEAADEIRSSNRWLDSWRGRRDAPHPRDLEVTERGKAQAEADLEYARQQLPGDWEPDGRGPRLQVRSRNGPGDRPDLFAQMEPITPRPATGVFSSPTEDRGNLHFDQNHADLDRLGRLAQRKGASKAQLNAEASRLADEMGSYMNWTDVPGLSRGERRQVERTGVPTASMMLKAARQYVHDVADMGPGHTLYDPDKYADIARRWDLHEGGRPRLQAAWHGSGADFDRFDPAFMKSGEGFHARGWGFYLAQLRQIAEYYRRTVGGEPGPRLGNIPVEKLTRTGSMEDIRERLKPLLRSLPLPHLDERMQALVNSNWGWSSLGAVLNHFKDQKLTSLEDVRKYAQNQRDIAIRTADDPRASLQAGLKARIAEALADSGKLSFGPGGRLYQTEIPDHDEMLHLDVPLHAQPPKVKQAMERIGERMAIARYFGFLPHVAMAMDEDHAQNLLKDVPARELANFGLGRTGAELKDGDDYYRHLADQLGRKSVEHRAMVWGTDELPPHQAAGEPDRPDPEAASRVLNQHGIPASRFLDADSRDMEPDSKGATYNYVVFDPDRIDIQAKLQRQPPFYSAVERLVERTPQQSAPAGQWLAMLGYNKEGKFTGAPGIKKDELDWMGLPDWLRMFSGQPVTKQAIQAFVQNHGVKVEETLLGSAEPHHWTPEEITQWDAVNQRVSDAQDQLDAAREEEKRLGRLVAQASSRLHREAAPHPELGEVATQYRAARAAYEGAIVTLEGRQEERERLHEQILGPSPAPARFTTWTTPGGINQRELLLTLPNVANPPETHWQTPGVVAHVRFSERDTPDGRKVLYVEEVQSDWHQKGRELGYGQGIDQAKLNEAQTAFNQAWDEHNDAAKDVVERAKPVLRAFINERQERAARNERDANRAAEVAAKAAEEGDTVQFGLAMSDMGNLSRFAQDAEKAARQARELFEDVYRQDEEMDARQAFRKLRASRAGRVFSSVFLDAPHELRVAWAHAEGTQQRMFDAQDAVNAAATPQGVTPAPFKSSWPALVMKRVTVWAAEHGFDRVAWSTGDENAQRAGQLQHVSRVALEHREGAELGEPGAGGGTGRFIAYHTDGSVAYVKQLRHLGDLRTELGQTLTDRLMAIEPTAPGRTPGGRAPMMRRDLAGLDERIGGHGMRQFYDSNLVNITNDIIRKHGGKVTQEPVLLGDAQSGRGPLDSYEWKRWLSDLRDAVSEFRLKPDLSAAEARSLYERLKERYEKLYAEARGFEQAGPGPDADPQGRAAHRMMVQDLYNDSNKALAQSRHLDRLATNLERYERLTQPRNGFDITDKLRDAAQQGFPLFQRATGPGSPTEGMERLDKGLRGTPIKPGEHTELAQHVEDMIRRLAPTAVVRGFEKLLAHGEGYEHYPGGIAEAHGASFRKAARDIIAWSLESPDLEVTARHEVIHFLRSAGFFTEKEWQALEKTAADRGWMDRYKIRERYAGEAPHLQLEEAIADAFSRWRRGDELVGGKLPPFAREVFQRLHNLLVGVARVARRMMGANPTAEDIFHAIEKGQVGRRTEADVKALEDRDAAKAAKAAAKGPVVTERVPKGERTPMLQRPRRPPGYTPITEGPEAEEPGLPFERGIRPRVVDKTALEHLRGISGAGMDRAGHKINAAASKLFGEPGQALDEALRMALNPMARGSTRAQEAAKGFANSLREAFWEHGKIDQYILKEFPRDQRKLMYEAGDQSSVLKQRDITPGEDQGLNRLDPHQRAVVEHLQSESTDLLELARQVGVTEAEGLPDYMPRMVAKPGIAGTEVLAREPPGQAWRSKGGVPGRNLITTTGQMRQRKYETLEQTEAAAKRAFGDKAFVVRDIRTLALANRRLSQAIAGRVLVDRIKEIGESVGSKTVTVGGTPDPEAFFTIPGHPALTEWKPAFAKDEDGKVVTVTNPDGSVHFEAHPIWISKEFEGPLRAVLSTPTNDLWKAAMNIKSKVVGVVMYSPLMHNAVLWGKALPATGWKAFGPIYFEGNRAKNDPDLMRQAINDGIAPVGQNYHAAELGEIAAEPGMVPGESWIGQLFAKVPQLYDKSPEAGQRTMEAADRLSNFWHNTLLWDRVGDLQMGIYVNMRNSLVRHANELGIHPDDAGKIAAHFANRYAGALPMEAMSKGARMLANTLLFSRSFTLGNIGTYKDMVAGLPTDVQAQIGARGGPEALASAQGIARRKAASMFIADVTFQYIGYALAAAAIYGIHQALGDRGWKIKMPWQNPTDKQNRVLAGYNADGTAFYVRLPTGKVAEDLLNWFTHPRTTFMNKANPIPTRMVLNVLANDKGFGKKIWQPDAPFGIGTFQNLGRVAWQSASDILPEGQIKAFADMMGGRTDLATGLLGTLLPITGVTISHGPNPAMADIYQEQDRMKFQLDQELPQLQQQWRDAQKVLNSGDRAKGMQMRTDVLKRYRALGVPPALARYYSRVALNPQMRVNNKKLRAFMLTASTGEKEQLQSDLADQKAYEASVAAPNALDNPAP